MIKDFSQSREQEAILKWAAGRKDGSFLDIGAGDGVTLSNTRALALAGWSGMVVEPSPHLFDKLSLLYADDDKIECVNTIVTANKTGLMPFYYVRADHISSLLLSQTEKWADVKFEQITVGACRLQELLDYFGTGFDFVNIDAEGTTMELLRAYVEHPLWKSVHCVCIEAETGEDRVEILEMLGWRRLTITDNNVVLWR